MRNPDKQLDEYLAPAADEIVALFTALAELGLIDEQRPGRYRHTAHVGTDEHTVAWEVERPEPRLYAFHPGTDTIVATRLRDDGRYEHAVLDEYGLPIEWRTAPRPDLN